MYSSDEYRTKMDLSKEVRVAKGDWLHLQMKLMNKIDEGKYLNAPLKRTT